MDDEADLEMTDVSRKMSQEEKMLQRNIVSNNEKIWSRVDEG